MVLLHLLGFKDVSILPFHYRRCGTGINRLTVAITVDGQGQKQAAEYSWRQTIVEPGLTVVCNGALNSCIGALP